MNFTCGSLWPRFGSKLNGRFPKLRVIAFFDEAVFDEAAFGPSAITAEAQHTATRLNRKPDSIRRVIADIRSPPKGDVRLNAVAASQTKLIRELQSLQCVN